MTQGKRTNIWTAAARQLLFEKLTEFGPYSTWASSSAPGRRRDQRYGEFFQTFVVVIGATSGAAVIGRDGKARRLPSYNPDATALPPDPMQDEDLIDQIVNLFAQLTRNGQVRCALELRKLAGAA